MECLEDVLKLPTSMEKISQMENRDNFEDVKNEGNIYFEQKDYEKAIERYSLAISIIENDPNQTTSLAKVLSNRSAAYLSMGKQELSFLDAERCTQLDPSWPKAYFRVGMALKSLQRYHQSKEAFERGLTLLSESGEENSKSRNDFIKNMKLLQELDGPSAKNLHDSNNLENGKNQLFLEDLVANGCSFHSISLQSLHEDYRGVFATTMIPSGSEIMKIPLSNLITVEMGMNCPFGVQLSQSSSSNCPPFLSSPKHTNLVLFILWDRAHNPSSIFHSYYSLLPKSIPSCPLFWVEDDLYLLLGSYLLMQVEERKANIINDYNELIRVLPVIASLCTQTEFILLRMIVASRNFSIEINGNKTEALVPMADMMNHRRPRDTIWFYDDTQQSFLVLSSRDLLKDEEIFDSYGKKCNSRYLLNYGFTVINNSDEDGTCYNQCCLEIGLDPNDPILSQKIERLDEISKSEKCSQRLIRLTRHLDDPETIDSFCYARFICATADELSLLPSTLPSPRVGFSLPQSQSQSQSQEEDSQGIYIRPLSLETELKVLKFLKTVVEEQLGYYLTTLEEDLFRRSHLTPYSNEWNACNVLIGEKEICFFYLDLFNLVMKITTTSLTEAIRVMKSRQGGERGNVIQQGVTEYLEKIILPLMIRKEKQKL